jgi:hypothetical protein
LGKSSQKINAQNLVKKPQMQDMSMGAHHVGMRGKPNGAAEVVVALHKDLGGAPDDPGAAPA